MLIKKRHCKVQRYFFFSLVNSESGYTPRPAGNPSPVETGKDSDFSPEVVNLCQKNQRSLEVNNG